MSCFGVNIRHNATHKFATKIKATYVKFVEVLMIEAQLEKKALEIYFLTFY